MSEEASKIVHLTDFSDRLSPMLVKELRQGMRTNLFTVAFILLQAFMVLCVLIGASTPNSGSDAVTGFFWFFVVVALLIVMPIRGFGALTSEINLNTMDLIQLTKLGAWRITFGKWAALVSQTLLLVCGILPYLVMRYFFGGVDLISELWTLFTLVMISMVLTAVTVGFSAFKSVLLRAAVVAGLIVMSFTISGLTMAFGSGRGVFGVSGLYTATYWWTVAGLIAACCYAIFFLLDLGASRIAPDAENHATRKRVGAVVFVGLVMLLPFAGVDYEFSAALSMVVIVAVGIDAVTERPSLVPSVLRPFVVRRPWSRPLAPFLTPGWHTGIRFFLVIFLLWVGFCRLHDPSEFKDQDFVLFILSIAGAVTFPLLLIHLFMKDIVDTPACFSVYVLIQCAAALLGIFLVAVESAIGDTAYLIFPVPMVTLFAAINDEANSFLILCAAVMLGLSVLVPAWRSIPLGKVTRYIARQLRDTAKDS